MALAKDLIQVGIPDQAAKRLGYQYGTLTSAGTTSADAAACSATATLVEVTGAASSGIKLSADSEVGMDFVYANTSANAILIYPPTGGQINGDTATTGTVPLAARGTTRCIRTGVNTWAAICGAAG
ncbi:hypothetical protein [Tardiphaga sp. 841_E9_N1_2]|uniref:hypothetical protein n=1 Tax=Tardiphaga sp. 841_E9_N1_2 TaxID=3240762 RepID=UPI003F269B72